MSNEHANWVGQTVGDGRFHIHRKLGEGGMGYVYQAHDHVLDTDVVIKVPRRSMLDDPEFKARFARENRALVELRHPHIVSILFVGEAEGLPYAVMQYLSGGDLKERQLSVGRGQIASLPPQDLKTWLPGIATALDFIHGQGFIHRDVKPANILFDGHGNVYLSDFGVAKVVSEKATRPGTSLTGTGMVLGTPEYMAKELIMGEHFDGKVDQYALGTSVYEVLCGRTPFEGTKSESILVKQVTETIPPLSNVAPSCSQALSDAVMKSLSKEPLERYPNCMVFADAVLAAVSGWSPPSSPREDVPPRPTAPPARSSSETTRNNQLVTAAQPAITEKSPVAGRSSGRFRSKSRLMALGSFWLGLVIVFSAFLSVLTGLQSESEAKPSVEHELTDAEKRLAVPLASHWEGADFTNRMGMKFIGIAPGRYVGDSKPGENWEKWQGLEQPIWMSECEVSVADYLAFVKVQQDTGGKHQPAWLDPDSSNFVDSKTSPYRLLGESLYQNGSPITGIRHADMIAFCTWLSEQPGEPMHYRLPTREEWICAYRAGTDTAYYWGEEFQAGKCRSSVEKKNEVALARGRSLTPNAWGFYHMAGNVSEMLSDGTQAAGGNWKSHSPEDLAAAAVIPVAEDQRLVGFRIVAEPKAVAESSGK